MSESLSLYFPLMGCPGLKTLYENGDFDVLFTTCRVLICAWAFIMRLPVDLPVCPQWTLRLLNSLFHNFPLSSAQKLPVLFLTSVCMVSLAASLPHIYLKMKFHQIENWDFHRSCIKCVQQFGKNLHSYSIVFPTEALLISPFRRVFFYLFINVHNSLRCIHCISYLLYMCVRICT